MSTTLTKKTTPKTQTAQTTESRRTVIPEHRIHRKEDAYELLINLPGVIEKNLQVHLESRWLKIKGSPNSPVVEGFRNIHEEFTTPDYECEFKVPNDIDPEKTSAKLMNGVLTVVLSKAVEHLPRSISINAS